jgi:hypothetical protein
MRVTIAHLALALTMSVLCQAQTKPMTSQLLYCRTEELPGWHGRTKRSH